MDERLLDIRQSRNYSWPPVDQLVGAASSPRTRVLAGQRIASRHLPQCFSRNPRPTPLFLSLPSCIAGGMEPALWRLAARAARRGEPFAWPRSMLTRPEPPPYPGEPSLLAAAARSIGLGQPGGTEELAQAEGPAPAREGDGKQGAPGPEGQAAAGTAAAAVWAAERAPPRSFAIPRRPPPPQLPPGEHPDGLDSALREIALHGDEKIKPKRHWGGAFQDDAWDREEADPLAGVAPES